MRLTDRRRAHRDRSDSARNFFEIGRRPRAVRSKDQFIVRSAAGSKRARPHPCWIDSIIRVANSSRAVSVVICFTAATGSNTLWQRANSASFKTHCVFTIWDGIMAALASPVNQGRAEGRCFNCLNAATRSCELSNVRAAALTKDQLNGCTRFLRVRSGKRAPPKRGNWLRTKPRVWKSEACGRRHLCAVSIQ